MPQHPPATQEQIDFIKANYLEQDDEAIARHLNLSKKRVSIWRRELGFTKESGKPRVKVDDNPYFNWDAASRLDFIVNS